MSSQELFFFCILYFPILHFLIYLVFSEALNKIILSGHWRENSLHLQRWLLQHQLRAAPRDVVAGGGHDDHNQAVGLGCHVLYFSMFYNIILCFSASIIKCTFASSEWFIKIFKSMTQHSLLTRLIFSD